MLLDISLPVWTLPLICVVAITARFLYNKFGYGISRIPGPFLASYTNLWRFFLVWGGRAELTHIKLHEKYGPLVRLGPKNVSVSDFSAVKVIYGLGAGYDKVSTVSLVTTMRITIFSLTVRLLPRSTTCDKGWLHSTGIIQYY
jgi:hypothetical protein